MNDNMIKWDLSDFYDGINDPKITGDIQDISALADEFNREVKGKLKDPLLKSGTLLNWYKKYEGISEKMFYLETYSNLIYSTNNLDDEIKGFQSKVEEFTVKIQEKMLFFNLELNKISDEKFNELINAPEMAKYTNVLKKNRLRKPHQLTEKEEQIILMKDITGASGFLKLYMEIKSSFTYDFEVDGQIKTLTEAELFSSLYQQDKDIRKKALGAITEKYKDQEMIFTHILTNILKNWDLESKKKNFITPISRRNLDNEVNDDIVEVLGKVTSESYKVVERYYNLKKKLLNLPELHMSDLYCPIGEISRKYTYEESIELIKNVNEKFHPEFKEIIQKTHELQHIDVTPRKGKNRGAFCEFGKLKKYAFVFVNFTNTVDSLLTLAHELGHAIQAYYIQRDQNFINVGLSLAIAEIASIFNEILMFDHLMETDLSKDEKIALLAMFLENNFATSFRQNAFYNFETRVHDLIEKKLPTTEEIKNIFADEMEAMFGNSIINLREEYAVYCFVIPHFLHTPFYVYAYNMSNLLVISLYQLYLEQKEKFVPKFVKLLSFGSSISPEEMLQILDIDLKDPSFWRKGIAYLEGKQSELEDLVENK
ncbi:MAG: M3 family oligoendopeptidase [Candidatus Lokiarchaeota archaeon]|nr:M3 family oligoendopeptidase [Candidatus Lokiarchaeota archaeon]